MIAFIIRPMFLKHWVGITWFLGWGVAVWQAVENWIDKRKSRLPEQLAMQTNAGKQAIRLVAHYQGAGPYSEDDLRAILRKARLDESRVLPVIWELEESGHAEKDATLDGTVSWFVT